MYNIQKAVSRLDFAPKLDRIKITDIKKGLGNFAPKPDKQVSFASLKGTLKKAGYTLDSAVITVSGPLVRDSAGWWVESDASKQRFALAGDDLEQQLEGAAEGAHTEITGDWQTVSDGATSREVIRPRTIKKVAARDSKEARESDLRGIQVSLAGLGNGSSLFFAPVRTTSPGLTVYKGGAVVPRYSYTRQHLGDLKVDRHALRLGISYTPTPTLQLEAEIPYSGTSFEHGTQSGSGHGPGNITLWGKYRFYRTLETWGDRQAALRFGVELPTGKKSAPAEQALDAPAFVRQQLSTINGGFAVHLDAAYSQAKNRFIYGANIEGTLRSERDGFRLGHELRVNTDLEYVLLPFAYRRPTKELFVLLETSTVVRKRGRVAGVEAPGSSATEFYLAPALQYVATPRWVIEASYQVPVIRNTGPLALRTDASFLIGVRYLY